MHGDYEEWEAVSVEDLLDDGRYEDAERALGAIPPDGPDGPWALSLRAICLSELRRDDEALALAQQAVAHDPQSAFSFWTLGALLSDRDRLHDAMSAAQRAANLEPDDARHHALIAQIHARRGDWRQAREAAERGLRVDPDDEACNSLRTIALRGTTSGSEWSAAADNLVHAYPASGLARAGRGWSLLESGRAYEARQDFEQALSLDPTSGWAREGLIESIKAANPVYASMLRFFLWLDRLPPRTRWTIIIGGIFLFRVFRRSTEANPALAPLTYPLMAAWIMFIAASWTALPLSDFVLSRSQLGRRLVTGERLAAANAIAGLLGIAIVCGAIAVSSGSERFLTAALGATFLIIPVAGLFQCSPGWPRNVMIAYTGVASALLVIALTTSLETGRVALFAVVVMGVLGSWIVTFLAGRRPAR